VVADRQYLAKIEKVAADGAEARSSDGVPLGIHPAWPVVILRDAPAPPVTVRREDYDALVAALNHKGGMFATVSEAAAALIDHADTEPCP
jgi:hypothetical protein